MVLDVRSDMFRHSHRLSQDFHDRTLTGALMYRINNQASAIGSIAVAIPPLAQAAATLVGMFIVTYTINRELALLSLTVDATSTGTMTFSQPSANAARACFMMQFLKRATTFRPS